MKKLFFTLFFFFIIFSFTIFGQDINALIKKGDAAFKANQYQEAISLYEEVLKKDAKNYTALWKLSNAYSEMGVSAGEKKKEEIYQTAVDYAKKAIESEPNKVEGHVMRAAAEGRLAMFKGGKEQIQMSKNIKMEAEKALEIDPNNMAALQILGVWHREIASVGGFLKFFAKILYGGLPDASLDKSLEYLQKAITLDPSNIELYLDTGKTLKEMDREEEAKQQFKKVIELPAIGKSDEVYKKEAKELLEDLE